MGDRGKKCTPPGEAPFFERYSAADEEVWNEEAKHQK